MKQLALRGVAALVAIAGAAVVLLGIAARLHVVGGELSLGEALSATRLLVPGGWLEHWQRTGGAGQSLLDHVLRWRVWLPLFGRNERALRLPSLLYGVAALGGCPAVAWRRLRTTTPLLAPLGALLAAAWWAVREPAIADSADVRLFALAGLVSLWWAAAFVLSARELPTASFRAASGAFLLVDPAAVVLVSGAYAALAVDAWGGARRRAVGRLALEWGALVGGALVLALPMYAGAAARIARVVGPHGWAAAVRLLSGLDAYARFPWGTGAVMLVALAAGALPAAATRRSSRRLAGLVVVGLPAALVARSVQPAFDFALQAFAPLDGVLLAALVLAIEVAPALLERLLLNPRRRDEIAVAVVVAITCARLAAGARELPRAQALPPAAFSVTSGLIERLKARPVFLVAKPCWNRFTVELYWNLLGAPPTHALAVAESGDAERCGTMPFDAVLARRLDAFAAEHPDGAALVLWSKPCVDGAAAPGVDRQPLGDNCAAVIEQPRATALATIATQEGLE